MKSRSRARGVALQVLYETDIANHPPADVFKTRLEDIVAEAVEEELKKSPEKKPGEVKVPSSKLLSADLEEFARKIIFGVLQLAQDLDLSIAKYAPEWPLDQIAAIDRNILRIALWEFAVYRETPVKVAINEAVELAKLYGSDSAPRFVNGVLGALAEHDNEIHQSIKHKMTLENKPEP
jgi:N utilization substance protein B